MHVSDRCIYMYIILMKHVTVKGLFLLLLYQSQCDMYWRDRCTPVDFGVLEKPYFRYESIRYRKHGGHDSSLQACIYAQLLRSHHSISGRLRSAL